MPSNQDPWQTLDLKHGAQEVSLPLDCVQREPREICFPAFTLNPPVPAAPQL